MDWAVLCFWLALLVPAVSYLLYPVGVILLASLGNRTAPAVLDASGMPWPSAVIAIAAHNEQDTIERVVRSSLAQTYPGPLVQVLVGLDGCTDGTAGVLERIGDPRVQWLTLPRQGKAMTDNALVKAATSEVVVTTSAGSEFAPGALAALIRPFRDPRIGCVTGIFRPRPDATLPGVGEGLYWRLEYGMMAAESRLGILGVASGTALAFRRSLFRPIPSDSDADVVVAPTAVLAGFRVVHEPTAVVYDDGPSSLRAVLRNRRRMALRAFPSTLKLVPRLLTAGRPGAALALVAHKLFRWLTPVAAVAWIVSATVLVSRGGSPYPALVAGILAATVVGVGIGLVRPRTRGAVVSIAVAQLAFGLAIVDVLLGRRARTWTRTNA